MKTDLVIIGFNRIPLGKKGRQISFLWLLLTNAHKLGDLKQQRFILSQLMEAAAAAAKSLQSCPTLCNPIDGSPPGSPVLGILQARTLEWVAISFSNA